MESNNAESTGDRRSSTGILNNLNKMNKIFAAATIGIKHDFPFINIR